MTENLEKLKTEALSYPERAKKIIVHNDGTLTVANNVLHAIKEMRKEIAGSYDPIIKKARATVDEARSEKKKYDGPLIEAEQTIKLHIGSYLEDQARIRREAEEKARKAEAERQKEEQRILDEAKILEDSGKTEEAEAMIEDVPLPAMPEDKLAVVEQGGLVFKQILDTERINRIVEQMQGMTKIPGIRVYPVWKWEITDRKLIPKGYYKSSVASRVDKAETETVTQGKPEDA